MLLFDKFMLFFNLEYPRRDIMDCGVELMHKLFVFVFFFLGEVMNVACVLMYV
jgi:hypothetical protein